jgi:hypothetical protein
MPARGRGLRRGQEPQADRRLNVDEDGLGARPLRVQQGGELVGSGDAHADHVVAGADHGAQRPGLAGVMAMVTAVQPGWAGAGATDSVRPPPWAFHLSDQQSQSRPRPAQASTRGAMLVEIAFPAAASQPGVRSA